MVNQADRSKEAWAIVASGGDPFEGKSVSEIIDLLFAMRIVNGPPPKLVFNDIKLKFDAQPLQFRPIRLVVDPRYWTFR